LDYGANYLVEFDAPSLWYETSLTIAADSLKNGIRTDYHTFTHSPADVRSALARLGLDLDDLESDDTFRIWDSYTQQTQMAEPEKVGKATPRDPKDIHTLDLKRWTEEDVVEPQRGIHEADSRRLHIDDDTSILKATRRLLDSAGWKVEAFTDPIAFLEHAAAHCPDVAVIDILMPQMSGLEVQTRLRRVSPSTRVIVLTAKDDPSVRRMAINAGASAFFIKGVESCDFLAGVKAAADPGK